MLSHSGIWDVIDRLAERHGLTASGLARRAGLDATAFNPSKRIGGDGRPRWPSTESLAKVMEATGTSVADLARLVADEPLGALEVKGAAPAGFAPAGFAEDGVQPPLADVADAHVVTVAGPPLAPLYRPGDRLVVSASAPIGRGNRVLYTDETGATAVAEVEAWGDTVALRGPDGATRRLPRSAVVFAARILWVSQ
ncbi:helix-turn-helix domain-containing protein [Oharaeibacter diazotrophicus]|uniref:Phage repressor protein C with HTH and peptisase S24 domain n=1 Tax=Oharaeibacter diazotrophicus TaxID=1920512 RepID=A0A4R6RA74_9HYPH|nr:helix-turn-helix transcriptional regulator [Oharaeibacter diazotrophicus]TDP82537.1 phage repressor protein C with HTH and peptisase S24 domain [Oharaeibacter diazotrophicus]BBE72699.1 hypothetical protein OHA_1_02297 [Pleomorphomonas sp. SM30]GLS76734.1 DNA-binding protein [Oharaeibacter diazotrophicus]